MPVLRCGAHVVRDEVTPRRNVWSHGRGTGSSTREDELVLCFIQVLAIFLLLPPPGAGWIVLIKTEVPRALQLADDSRPS